MLYQSFFFCHEEHDHRQSAVPDCSLLLQDLSRLALSSLELVGRLLFEWNYTSSFQAGMAHRKNLVYTRLVAGHVEPHQAITGRTPSESSATVANCT